MKRTIYATIEVSLLLSTEEAEWLHERMQNPQPAGAENARDTMMRSRFFEATKLPRVGNEVPTPEVYK